MRDDSEVDAAYYLGAPKNERERERSTHTPHSESPGSTRGREDDVSASSTGSPAEPAERAETAEITDASLRYGIVEETDDDLGEGLYRRRAA